MIRSNSSYVITPDAFSVNPSLVGLPLARPARRLTAMLLDLLFVAILVGLGGPVMLALAAAWAAFRLTGRLTAQGARPAGRTLRLGARMAGALVLFVVALNLWGRGRDAVKGMLSEGVQVKVAGGDSVRMSPVEALGLARQVTAFQQAEDEDEARRLSGELVAGFRASGMSDAAIRTTMSSLTEEASEEHRAWLGEIAEASVAPKQAARPAAPALSPDSLARAYAAAVGAHDSTAADSLRPRVASVLAHDSLDALRAQLAEARGERDEAARELKALEDRGLLSSLVHLLDDLGIGFGWSGLYFTAFVALWNGQTPGKRLLGVRVVRLDGRPMTMWSSFERFGGYAAGLVTGLLGFAQVYWDRNRQMIHDKIVETVVVRAGAPAVAAAGVPATPLTRATDAV
jgi:uncharacterized RDD family membrane protein YckC